MTKRTKAGYVLEKKEKLGYWMPCGNTQIINPHAKELSRQTKEEKVREQIKPDRVWEMKEYFMERTQFIMRYEDAKECLFNPLVGSKAPEKYKELIQNTYPSWG